MFGLWLHAFLNKMRASERVTDPRRWGQYIQSPGSRLRTRGVACIQRCPMTTGPPASLRVAVTSRLASSFDLNTNIRSSTDGMGSSHRDDTFFLLVRTCPNLLRRIFWPAEWGQSSQVLTSFPETAILPADFLAAWILVQTIKTELAARIWRTCGDCFVVGFDSLVPTACLYACE